MFAIAPASRTHHPLIFDPSAIMPPGYSPIQGAKRVPIPRAAKAKTDAAIALETDEQEEMNTAKAAADDASE